MSLMVTGVVSFLFKIFPKIQYMERRSNVDRASSMRQEFKMLLIKNVQSPEVRVIPIFNMRSGREECNFPRSQSLVQPNWEPRWKSLHGLHTVTLPQNFLLRTIIRIHLCFPFSFPNANNYITNNYIFILFMHSLSLNCF